jgi:Transcriptional regulators
MDGLDRKLITLLRRDSTRGISKLAAELGVSRATVKARIERLEREGEIIGYTVVLRSDVTELPVRGITMIEIKGQGTDRVVRALSGFPEVQAVHTTNGKWDLIVEIGTESLNALDDVLGRFRQIPGISGSETSLLLATPLSTKARLTT